ncbi:MAG: hypothetical protein NTY00_10300 [Deltaproteobacteria bacterium]|nr:hypothetical protein [Deltaproteobacteria bacterium]
MIFKSRAAKRPKTLQQLVPEFLPQLPEIKDSFILVYDPPTLSLQRPDRKKKTETGIP